MVELQITTLTADFAARDRLPQTELPPEHWYRENWDRGWGPRARVYPPVAIPAGHDPVRWQRERVLAVARRYLGLAYRRHHIPAWNPPSHLVGHARAGVGLDCSNFTAWVYNFGLGLKFTSNVQYQAESRWAPGRRLAPDEPLAPGDLLFIVRADQSAIAHVAIYLDPDTVIDSHEPYGGVTLHPLRGRHRRRFSHARRIIE